MTIATNAGLSITSNSGFSVGNQPAFDGGGFLPSNVEGLNLWLDAALSSTIIESGGAVSQWNDKSGSGNNATQGTGAAQPTTNASTQNGKNVIDFDGVADGMSLPNGIFSIPNGSNTMFVVCLSNQTSASERAVNFTVSVTTKYSLQYAVAANEVVFFNNTLQTPTSLTGVTKTNFNIFRCRRDGTTQAISINNSTENTTTDAINIPDIDAATIGNYLDSTDFLDGSIAEILIYDRSLSITEIDSIEEYLSSKWGIALA